MNVWATTAPGADEIDDDPDAEHEYVNTETDNNIESKKNYSYDIDKQCSQKLLNATNVCSESIPNTRFRKQQQFFFETNKQKTEYKHCIKFLQNSPDSTHDKYVEIGLNFCILTNTIDIT